MQAWPFPSTCCTCSAARRDRSHGVSIFTWARIALLLSVAGAEVDSVGFLGPAHSCRDVLHRDMAPMISCTCWRIWTDTCVSAPQPPQPPPPPQQHRNHSNHSNDGTTFSHLFSAALTEKKKKEEEEEEVKRRRKKRRRRERRMRSWWRHELQSIRMDMVAVSHHSFVEVDTSHDAPVTEVAGAQFFVHGRRGGACRWKAAG